MYYNQHTKKIFTDQKVEGSIKGLGRVNGMARLYKGYTSSDDPKTWRKVGVIRAVNLENRYNTGLCAIFKTKTGYGYSIFRDGSIYPYYGKIEFISTES